MTPTMPKMIDRPSAISTYRAPSTSPFSRNSVRTAGVIERRLRHRLQLALALGLRNRDRVQRLPLAGHLADDLERSEEHTSELQSRPHLVFRLLLAKKK